MQWLGLGLTGSLAATVAALSSGELPRWLRVLLVLAALLFTGAAGLYVYRYANMPVTLTLAAGSSDGDAARVMSALASHLASSNAPVRLKIVDKGNVIEATKAFTAGETDLAVVRSDIGDLSAARTIVLVSHGVVLLIVPQGGAIEDIGGLKGKTVGVIGGSANHRIVEVLTREYDLTRLKVRFQDLAPTDAASAVQSRKIQALLVVVPLSERYLGMLRSMLPANAKQKPALLAIESAGAIAELAKYYESFDLPKGTLRGSPPIPDDDLTTLRVPFYLVARKTLSEDTAGALAKAIIENRRSLTGEYPVMAQIAAPDSDKDAHIPIHPGAQAYFDGEQKTVFDKYGDTIFYGSIFAGFLTSILAGVWKFMGIGPNQPEKRPLHRLYAFADRIRDAQTDTELSDIERSIDEILRAELEKYAKGDADSGEVAALGLATHRLEYLVAQRRTALMARSAA